MKPLEGVRVLELARILAGPWCGQLLADLGAEVIKVERPGAGDDTRSWGPPFLKGDDGADLGAAYFHACNRGKRSIALDLESVEGQAKVRELAAGADVLIENFKVGGLAKYGLDAASLRDANPELIYCSITGFGQTGPYAARAGYDFMIQGLGGIMNLTGDPAGEPQKVGVAYADIFTGVYAAVAVLAALRRRDVAGEGAELDLSLLDCQVGVLANQAMNFLASGVPPKRLGNAHPNIAPYQTFPTHDGYVILAVGNDRQFARLVEELGAPHLALDARFASNADRVGHRAVLAAELSELIRARPAKEFLGRLAELGVPAGSINDVGQVFDDPQVLARGLRLELASPHGSIPGVASPVVIDGERMVAPAPSPRLGEAGEDLIWAPRAAATLSKMGVSDMDDPVIAQVYAFEDRRFNALAASDLQALAPLLATDLNYAHANGMIEDKAEFLRKITSGERRYLKFASVGRRARREGGFTFVFGEADVEVDRPDKERLVNRLTYTAIYRDSPEPSLFAWHAVKSIEG